MMKFKQELHTKALKSLSEAINTYVKESAIPASYNLKGNHLDYSDFFENKMLIIQSIRKGISYKLYNKIKEITPFSENEWATYLNLSLKTLQRYKLDKKHLFKPIHSEKIIELAEVYLFAIEVFDSSDQFYSWLNTPSYALANLKPSELLRDSYGKELVMDELNRIEHGVFA